MSTPADRPLRRPRSVAVDALKAGAIVFVVLQHGLPAGLQIDLGRQFWLQQAVPVFLLTMGLNGGLSAARTGGTLAQRYGRAYWVGRIERLFLPFAVVWIVALAIALAAGTFRPSPQLLVGNLPLDGPGSYFVGLLGQFVVVFPLLAWAFARRPWATTVVAVAANVAFEIWAGRHAPFRAEPYPLLYHSCVLRFGALLVLGLWLARVTAAGRALPRATVVGLGATSTALLVAWSLRPELLDWTVPGFGRPTSFPFAGYVLLIVLAALGPERRLGAARRPGRVAGAVRLAGDASFHVFLVQIVWFALLPGRGSALEGLLAVPATLALGIALQRAMDRLPPLPRGPGPTQRPAAAGRAGA